jgi:hypothetical protein
MYDLRNKEEVSEKNEPFIIVEEVGKSKVDEEAKIKLYVESSEFFPNELGIIHVYNVLAPPNKEQHLHVKDNKDDDVGKGGQDEEEISTFRTHYVLNMRHCL